MTEQIRVRGCACGGGYQRILESLWQEWTKTGIDVQIFLDAQTASGIANIPAPMSRDISDDHSGEWHLSVGPPGHAPMHGQSHCSYTMWESTRLKPEWVERLNRSPAVFVPSNWMKEVFNANGVDSRIVVAPPGIDGIAFNRKRRVPRTTPGIVRFGTLIPSASEGATRKNVDLIFEAFYMACEATPGQQAILSVKMPPNMDPPEDLANSPLFEFHNQRMSDTELADWYGGLDFYVSASSCEAYGFCEREALACGCPVICPRYAGLCDITSGTSLCEIPYTLGQTTTAASIYLEGNQAQVEIWDIRDAIRTAIQNASQANEIALPAHFWSPADTANHIAAELRKEFDLTRHRETMRIPATIKRAGISVMGPRSRMCGVGQYARAIAREMGADYCNYAETPSAEIVLYHHHRHYHESESGFDTLRRLSRQGYKIFIDLHDIGGYEQVGHLAIGTFYHTRMWTNAIREIGPSVYFPLMSPKIDLDILPGSTQLLGGRHVLGWHGLWQPHKGVETLLDAVTMLRNAPEDDRATCDVILSGGIHDINDDSRKDSLEYAKQIAKRARRMTNADINVSCEIKDQNQKAHASALAHATIFVLPYAITHIGNSSALSFCVAMRKPIVCSPSPMFQDALHFAKFASDFDSRSLANSIRDVARNSHVWEYYRKLTVAEYALRNASVTASKYKLWIEAKV